jgi:hypothetical protein
MARLSSDDLNLLAQTVGQPFHDILPGSPFTVRMRSEIAPGDFV